MTDKIEMNSFNTLKRGTREFMTPLIRNLNLRLYLKWRIQYVG